MQIINAVQIHIFSVPGECSLPHAKVKICGADPLNEYSVVILHVVQNGAQAVNVPVILVVIRQ